MRVTTYSTKSGDKVNITRAQATEFFYLGIWPKNEKGEAYGHVYFSEHNGERVSTDVLLRMARGKKACG